MSARAARPEPVDEARRELMRRVRRSRTAAEELVAAALRRLGVRYRRNVKGLPGSPDFANLRRGFAIFVNGCFWHHHRGCRLATVPRHNREFWLAKFRDNRRRDARKIRELRRRGLKVLLLWQCEAEDPGRLETRLRRFFSRLQQGSSSHSTGGQLRRS